jgi:hypothetical protein
LKHNKYRTAIFQLESEFKIFNPCQKGKGKFTYCAPIEEYQIDLERPTNFAATKPLKKQPSTKIYQIN